jgi:hypothetical protein
MSRYGRVKEATNNHLECIVKYLDDLGHGGLPSLKHIDFGIDTMTLKLADCLDFVREGWIDAGNLLGRGTRRVRNLQRGE